MFEIIGRTTDGQTVVKGVYRFFETHGMPLEVVLDLLKQKGYLPCWMSLYRECLEAGMKHDRILSKLEPAIVDVYGSPFRDYVLHGLEVLHEKGHI